MATFYLMPTRQELGRRFSSFLQNWFPGTYPQPTEFHELLAEVIERNTDVYVLYADDVPDVRGESLDECLCVAFGAADGDRVIDLRVGPIDGVSPDSHVIGENPALLRFGSINRMAA